MNHRSSVFTVLAAVVVGLGVWGVRPGATPRARADEGLAAVVKAGQLATAEELKQILFTARVDFTPPRASFELHNALRTRTIEGIVIHVEFNDPQAADKKVELDLFARCPCPPLTSAFGQEGFFRAEDASKVPVTITLKEVYFTAAPEHP